jgi:putative flippase GtrA
MVGKKSKLCQFTKYAFRWQLSTPILAPCIVLAAYLGFNSWIGSAIANLIGACIFFFIDKYFIFKVKEEKIERLNEKNYIT